ncbi:MAG: peptidoglycan DD-metalloendopeptidase family protein [Balneolales bacterium]|nr:peptidoglycan DD-metalloendopeptidase family protein [Balneolales bacterium]
MPFKRLPSSTLIISFYITGLMFLSACLSQSEKETSESTGSEYAELVSDVFEPETDEFGLPGETYTITERRVRNGENLSMILSPFGVTAATIHQIAADRSVFNVRRINSGRNIRFYENPQTNALDFFVYSPNNRSYIVFDLTGESPVIEENFREETIEVKRIEGDINGSLYVSIMEQGGSPALVSALANVFAWQVDFYGIQRGDRFAVVYEQRLIDGNTVGIGKIKAAYLKHRNSEFYGFYFEQSDGRGNYFDAHGNSLQKAFLRAPLDYSRISSRFTNRRFHPVLGRNMPHHGTDYAAPTGTPIRAVGDGVITHSAFDRNNGNYIRIRHNSVYETGYLHMSRIRPGMNRGATVRQGDIIGYVGQTGLATGPHLCFRFWQNGQPVDPLRVEMPPSEPIESKYLFAFEHEKNSLLAQLFPEDHKTKPALILAESEIENHFTLQIPSVFLQ